MYVYIYLYEYILLYIYVLFLSSQNIWKKFYFSTLFLIFWSFLFEVVFNQLNHSFNCSTLCFALVLLIFFYFKLFSFLIHLIYERIFYSPSFSCKFSTKRLLILFFAFSPNGIEFPPSSIWTKVMFVFNIRSWLPV